MNIRQTLARWFYSPGAYGLWLALEDVENWRSDPHTRSAVYRWKDNPQQYRSGEYVVRMNVSSRWRFDGEEATPRFLGPLERHFLWRKYKSMNNRRVLFLITRLEQPR